MVDGQIECTDILELWREEAYSVRCAVVAVSPTFLAEMYLKLYDEKVRNMLLKIGLPEWNNSSARDSRRKNRKILFY